MDGMPAATSAVYPRVCGGTRPANAQNASPHGLSPRVRGNRGRSLPGAGYDGSIPACAGEPTSISPARFICRVYPRVCGGTNGYLEANIYTLGLSPRVRGNPRGLRHCARRRRSIPACAGEPHSIPPLRWPTGSIPACAGEPSSTRIRAPARAVYPRVCGGTLPIDLRYRYPQGLSPRVRGNHWQEIDSGQRIRSIPACAGEPRCGKCPASRGRVYPRVCGGTRQVSVQRRMRPGLSPRVRGNHLKAIILPVTGGSIPACAGEPIAGPIQQARYTVYPRVCGGTAAAMSRRTSADGLSPRVRGNQTAAAVAAAAFRSIPACAGEPSSAAPWAPPGWVYPRVCGGTELGRNWAAG